MGMISVVGRKLKNLSEIDAEKFPNNNDVRRFYWEKFLE